MSNDMNNTDINININDVNNRLFKTASFKQNYIIIYTPPKVGSTSIVSSLRISLSKNFNIVHLHDDKMLQDMTSCPTIKIADFIILNNSIGKKVYVIDIYRSPVERKLSEFFEKIGTYHFNNTEDKMNLYPLTKIVNRFNNIFPYISNDDYYNEKYGVTKIEVKDEEGNGGFDTNKKYMMEVKENVTYIKLRLKDSGQWGTILSSIFEKEIYIVSDYETEKKVLGDLYKKFKNEYILPYNFYCLLEYDIGLKTYYSKEERNEYLQLWKRKTTSEDNFFEPFTQSEYIFYYQLCIDNHFYTDMQREHYIDSGCICMACIVKRKSIIEKVKNGLLLDDSDKIKHFESVNIMVTNIQNKVNHINQTIAKKRAIMAAKNRRKGRNGIGIQLS
jgi:hypothetical protein